jgi:signal peptidase II
MNPRLPKFLGWVTLLVVIDQLVKFWARNAAQGIEGRTFWPIWPNVFEFKLVYNQGVAFGMAQGAGVFLTPIALLITGYSTYHIAKNKQDPPGVFTGLVLLVAGAIGNLIDRLTMGKVTDMFYARFIDFPVFNVADICITFAGATIVILALKDSLNKSQAERPQPETSTPSSE